MGCLHDRCHLAPQELAACWGAWSTSEQNGAWALANTETHPSELAAHWDALSQRDMTLAVQHAELKRQEVRQYFSS